MTLAVFLSSNDDFLLSDILVRNIHDCYGEKVIYIILNSKDLIFPAEFFRDNNNYKHVEKVTPLIDILQQSFSDGKFGKKKIKNIKHLKKVVEFFEREYVESIFLICENNIFSNIILEIASLQTNIPTVLKLLDIEICDNIISKTYLKNLELKDDFHLIIPSIDASLTLFNRFPDIDKSIIIEKEICDKKSVINIQLMRKLEIPSSDIVDIVFLNIRDFQALDALQTHILKMKAYTVKCQIIIPICNYIMPERSTNFNDSHSYLLKMCQFLDRRSLNNVKLVLLDNSMLFLNIDDFQLYLNRFIFHSTKLLTLANLFDVANLIHEINPSSYKVKDVELMVDDECQRASSEIIFQLSRSSIFTDVSSVASSRDESLCDDYDDCPCSIC